MPKKHKLTVTNSTAKKLKIKIFAVPGTKAIAQGEVAPKKSDKPGTKTLDFDEHDVVRVTITSKGGGVQSLNFEAELSGKEGRNISF